MTPLKGKTYDYLKYLAQILLPAVGTLYFALAGIWNLPSAQEVVGTIVVVDTFLGVLLGISQAAYNNSDDKYDGKFVVTNAPTGVAVQPQFKQGLSELIKQGEVTLKVEKPE